MDNKRKKPERYSWEGRNRNNSECCHGHRRQPQEPTYQQVQMREEGQTKHEHKLGNFLKEQESHHFSEKGKETMDKD